MDDLQWLFTPNWQETPIGSRVSVVVTDIVWHGSTGVGKVTPGEQRTRVVGLVPPEAFWGLHCHAAVCHVLGFVTHGGTVS